jgi:TetR/AcrR family transcriptional regulator, mexJK operon transcriptional repressor
VPEYGNANRPSEEVRLQSIHETALESFVQEGYSGASMASIARAVGGSKTTLYARYPSKKALFLAVVRFEMDRFFESISRFPSPELDIERALHKHCIEFARAAQSVRTRNLFRLVISECHRLPEIQRDFNLRVTKHLAALSAAIEASVGKSSGVTLDWPAAAKLLFDLDMNFLYQQLQDRSTTPTDSSFLEEHASTVMGILLPPLTKAQQR